MFPILIIVLYVISDFHVNCDVAEIIRAPLVSHHFDGYKYEIPGQSELPEIIINKRANTKTIQDNQVNGYNYDKPQQSYLPIVDKPQVIPPLSDEPFFDNEYIPPFADDSQSPDDEPPRNNYLPSKTDEVLINYSKNSSKSKGEGGYNYPTPLPPLSDEIPAFPDNNNNEEPSGYFYDPPIKKESLKLVPQGRQLGSQSILKLELAELKCHKNRDNGFIRVVINVRSFLELPPVIDIDSIDTRCPVAILQSRLLISIAASDFDRCGVQNCGNDLCLRLRFPHIREMKTINDEILTLQCKVQEKVKERIHTIKMGSSDVNQKRSNGLHAQGGAQFPFRTDVAIYRKSGSDLNAKTYSKLQSGGVVQLGEELILRAHINAGDGWNFTRLSDVILQRNFGKENHAVALIQTSGCVNPQMKSICPHQPIFEPPLGHRFSFKAVMFQGMKSGDEIQMSVRLVGCMEHQDCYVDPLACGGNSLRGKRSVLEENSDTSTISFRVEFPKAMEEFSVHSQHFRLEHKTNTGKFMFPFVVISGLVVFVLIMLIVFLAIKNKHYFFEK